MAGLLVAFMCCKHGRLGCHDLQVGKAMCFSQWPARDAKRLVSRHGAAASRLYKVPRAAQLGRRAEAISTTQLALPCFVGRAMYNNSAVLSAHLSSRYDLGCHLGSLGYIGRGLVVQ